MKFPNQAKLLRLARHKTGVSQAAFGAYIGLPNTQLISEIERGNKPLTVSRWRLLEHLVGKNRIVDACTADFELGFQLKYEGAL